MTLLAHIQSLADLRDATLRALAAQVATRYAGEQGRLDRGLVLALNDHVTIHPDGTAHIQSGTDAEVVYRLNGHCDCYDSKRAPEGRCKHRWAACLVKLAIQVAQSASETTLAQTMEHELRERDRDPLAS
jgi:hypothetical protein